MPPAQRSKNESLNRVGIVGIPFSKGQPKSGTECGPDVMRNAGLTKRLTNYGCDVKDHGDVEFDENDEIFTIDDVAGNVKNPRTVAAVSRKTATMVAKSVREDGRCLTLGGDHSIAIGTIIGHARVNPDLCVLWIDAHADINTPLTSDSGNIHGMPLAFLVKELAPYVPKLPGFEDLKPCLSVKNIAWIGLRDVDKGERKIIEKFNMTAFSMQEVDKFGINEVVRRALDAIDPHCNRPIHVSFDVDAMDPTLAPSTGTPVVGGLSIRESFYIAEEVASTGRLTVVDIAEVNPGLGDPKDVKVTIDTTLGVVERFYGNRRQGVYPSGYDIPHALTSDVDFR